MPGLNRRLAIPTLLIGVVLISGVVLAQSAAELEEEEVLSLVHLPVISERQEGQVVESSPTPPRPTPSTISEPPVSQAPTTTSTETTTSAPIQTITPEPTTTPVLEPQTVAVTLVIQGPGISLKHSLDLAEGSTVYTLLKHASSEFDFSLKVSHHSSLGMFVEGIAGSLNNPKNNRYWLYYLNGQFASRGVSTQVVKEGDLIKWSYE